MFFAIFLLALWLVVFYFWLIARYVKGWSKLANQPPFVKDRPSIKISIVVAARNEADGIVACINSLRNQTYSKPLYEIIIVDDCSEDNTAFLVQGFEEVVLLKTELPLVGKKNALALGVEQAKGELIVTTDADCIVPPDWLRYLGSYYETFKPQLIAGPVVFEGETSLFQQFQSLDFLGMMAVAASGVYFKDSYMCNGANMAYTKAAFQEVGGFEGIQQLASGDDMLLMEKIAAKYPDQIAFLPLKEITTKTKAVASISAFYQQRIRWATKSAAYKHWKTQAMLATVWIYCWMLVLSAVLAIVVDSQYLSCFTLLFVAKMVLDFYFLNFMSKALDKRKVMAAFPISFIYHIIYILVIGTTSLFVKEYQWKGRKTQ